MFDERFARQYRYEPPSEFPLSLLFTGIVHHLSGPSMCAHTQTSHNWSVGCRCGEVPALTFVSLLGVAPQTRTRVRLLGPCFKTGRRKLSRNQAAYRWISYQRAHPPGKDSAHTRCLQRCATGRMLNERHNESLLATRRSVCTKTAGPRKHGCNLAQRV